MASIARPHVRDDPSYRPKKASNGTSRKCLCRIVDGELEGFVPVDKITKRIEFLFDWTSEQLSRKGHKVSVEIRHLRLTR